MTRLKKLFISMLAVIGLLCTMISITAFASTEETIKLVQTESDITTDGWNYGYTVTRPSGSISINDGEPIKATVTVVYPNGETTTEKEFVLKLEGNYTVQYSAMVGGEEKVYEEPVVVRQNLFHVTSAKSSVEYTTYKYSEHVVPEYTSVRESVINSSVEGLQVNLASGDEFRFGEVIDVSELTKLDTLIKVVMAPNQIGVADVDSFDVVLTDAYDPTNYITITTSKSGGVPLCYVLSSASNGQKPTGWEFNRGVKHVGKNGTPVRYSFTGPCANSESTTLYATSASQNDERYGINGIADNDWSLSFDYATKQVHNITSAHASDTTMLVDFDDPTHFEKIWKGFKTGECFLSIKANGYASESFNFIITEMYGVKNLKRYEFIERGELDVDVELGAYSVEEGTIPLGKVGVEYPLFTASTTNPYFGTLDATYEVFAGEEVVEGQVPVCKNGEKFIPQTAGNYIIRYTVTDYFGTSNHEDIPVVVKATDAFAPVAFELENETKNGIAGQYVVLADAVNHNGGSGLFTITKSVKFGEEDVEVKNNMFFPAKNGTYTVTITATDYIGESSSQSYNVEIGTGDRPVFVDVPTIPKYFISGQTYVLPEIFAYDYTDGSGTPVPTKIVYIDGEGIKMGLNREITPVVNQNKSGVDIIYYADVDGITYTSEGNLVKKDVPVIDVMQGDLVDFSKLFAVDGMEIGPDAKNRNMLFKAASSNASAELINAIAINTVSVRFQPTAGKTAFEAFTITLTDSLNADEQVKLMYIPNDDSSSFFRINNYEGAEYFVEQSIVSGATFVAELKISDNGVKFDSTSATIAGFDEYLNGEPFKGFSSNKVYLTFGFEGASNAEVAIINVSGQKIYPYLEYDMIAPAVAYIGEYKGYAQYGGEFRVPAAVVADVIDPTVVGTVTVELPADANGNRKIATSKDGVYLKNAPIDRDYKLPANLYGSYQVTFKTSDSFGNEISETYLVNVVDTIAPTITIPSGATAEGKVGKLITLKPATAVDNVDGVVDVLTFVYSPASAIYELPTGVMSFKTNAAGTYRVMYVARDAAGNIAIKTYKLVVTA